MTGTGVVAAALLAATFVVAATAKLRAPQASAIAFRELRLPAADLLARAVPAVELALAAVLVVRPVVGGAAALALLGAFSVVLLRAVRSGRDVPCGCFGSADSDPVDTLHVARNGLLGVLALAALAAPTPAVPALADVVLVTTAAAVAAVLLALGRMRAELGAVWATVLPGESSS